MIQPEALTGIILAGGKSSRMGTDKGLLHYNKKPFIQHSINALAPLVSKTIIVSDHDTHDGFNVERITDLLKGAGPVSGIYSGLAHSKTPYNIVLSCDVPMINTPVLQLLIDNYNAHHDIIQAQVNDKTMPLIALYKTTVKSTFKTLLENNERRLRKAVNACSVKNVHLDKTHHINTANINTTTDLKQLQDAHNH